MIAGPTGREENHMIIGAHSILVASAVANMLLLPHPSWMWVAGPVVILGAGWLGARLARPASPIPAI